MNEETKAADLAQRVADLERLCDTYKAAWSGYHPLADYMQKLSGADKLPASVLGRHYGDTAVEHMRAQEARIADMEAQRDTTAAHVAMIARQLGDEALQVDDIAVRVLALAAERDKLQHEYHTVRANAQARVDEALIRALSAEQARRDAQALAERYQAERDAAGVQARREVAEQVRALTAERDKWRNDAAKLLAHSDVQIETAQASFQERLTLDRASRLLTAERNELRARLADLGRQEPVEWRCSECGSTRTLEDLQREGYSSCCPDRSMRALFARPVPAIPEGRKLVPAQAETVMPRPALSREAIADTVADLLGSSVYTCLREWSAWGYGTMGQDDFVLSSGIELPMEIADAVVELLRAAPDAGPAQAVPDADGARFRWLCEDHSDRETRERCRSLIDRLSVMSHSDAVMSIDAAMAAAPEHKA